MPLDWGSLADWVGAIGGVSGAGTAATFYFLDRKRARVAQEAEETRQAKFDADVAIRLHEMVRSTVSASKLYLTQKDGFGGTLDLRAHFAATALTANRMLRLPGLSIDRFTDICDLLEGITDRRIEGKDPGAVRDAVAHVQQVADAMKQKLALMLQLEQA